jgi:uncharacterized protein (DUF58 family)
MRALIGALTRRGKSFLAAGCAAVVCGLAVREAELLRIGLLLLMLPLLSALAASRARYRLACMRQITPRRVPAGHAAEVRMRLSNVSRLRTGLLLAEDVTPYALGIRPRFVLEAVEPGGSRDLSYQIRSEQRGKFTVGPLQVRVADAFGLVEIGRSFATQSTLVVTPKITRLPHVGAAGNRLGSGESGMRMVAAAGEDDIAPRAYRDGDELRRVHWRSTARYGELMVRREEQQWHNRALLLVDTRRRAHVGSGPGSSFEFAVSAAASIGVHLAARGIETLLITDAGEVMTAGRAADSLLDMLAVIRPSHGIDLGSGLAALRGSSRGQIIAVSGLISPDQARQLAASHRGPAPAMALLLDVSRWEAGRPVRGRSAAQRSEAGAAAEILANAGWHVAVVTAGTSLAAAWRDLHRPATGGFRRRSTGNGTPGDRTPGNGTAGNGTPASGATGAPARPGADEAGR